MRNELQIFVSFVGGYCEITNLSLAHISSESESHSELSLRSKVESFAKIVNEFYRITIFKRNFILEISDRQGSKHASANMFQPYPKGAFYC